MSGGLERSNLGSKRMSKLPLIVTETVLVDIYFKYLEFGI